MNHKDKEAFEKWIDNDALSQEETSLFKNMSEQERVVFVTERTWQAACEYIQAELAHHIFKIEAENKKLRECVEYYADLDDECIGYDIRGVTTAREALKEIKE